MTVLFRYREVCQHFEPDITLQSISVESKCVFKKLEMQDLDFTLVKAPCSTNTNGGSAWKFLQSLELHVTALDWIMVRRNMVTERNLTEGESKCLG